MLNESSTNAFEIQEIKPLEQEPKEVAAILPNKRNPNWQDRLLPIMSGVLIGLTIFFFIATFIQMSYLHSTILRMPTIDFDEEASQNMINSGGSFEERYKSRQFEVRSQMEILILTNRYRQANVMLMASLWIKYLGFITGMVISIIGSSFVLGKLREPIQKLEGKSPTISISLQTASPGIILVVLGVLLMGMTIVDKDTIETRDISVYLPIQAQINSQSVDNLEALTTLEPPSQMLSPGNIFVISTQTPTPTLEILSTPLSP